MNARRRMAPASVICGPTPRLEVVVLIGARRPRPHRRVADSMQLPRSMSAITWSVIGSFASPRNMHTAIGADVEWKCRATPSPRWSFALVMSECADGRNRSVLCWYCKCMRGRCEDTATQPPTRRCELSPAPHEVRGVTRTGVLRNPWPHEPLFRARGLDRFDRVAVRRTEGRTLGPCGTSQSQSAFWAGSR